MNPDKIEPILISDDDPLERIVHLPTEDEIWALIGAQAANRPLLARGEPGIGKTQLAWAAARDKTCPRPIVSLTVDARTESRDLLWTFDAVQRLAESQVVSNLYKSKDDLQQLRDEIDVRRFVRPGPLWWALNWESAKQQHAISGEQKPPVTPQGWKSQDGVVVLIDEIDKAESDVPNGLLEVFGMRQFTPQGFAEPITMPAGTKPPLIIVTTNEERVLPDAFLRRCFVFNMELPDVRDSANKDAFVRFLVERGQVHFPQKQNKHANETLLTEAARTLYQDRRDALDAGRTPLPGLAEYLDLLRAVLQLANDGHDPKTVMTKLQHFVFNKSAGVA